MQGNWRRLCRPLAVLAAASLALGLQGAAAQDGWKAGLARVKVTPQERIFLAGYASRDRPFEKVESDLYAKALALEDPAGHRAVIVTSDVIGFRASVAEPMCARITEKTGLARRDILINSSHTHTGPTISLETEARGNMSEEDAGKTAAYTRQLQDQVVELVDRALADLKPCKLSWGVGVANFAMNRREFTERGVRLGFNPRGYVDRGVPVLRIDGPEGALRGVLFGYATHGTTLSGKHYFVCADYAGYAQEFIQQKHPGAEALFMIGCAGSSNPHPRNELKYSQQHGAELGEEVCRVLETGLTAIEGNLHTQFDRPALPLQAGLSRKQIEALLEGRQGWQRPMGRELLELLDRGEKLPDKYEAPQAVWRLGDELLLVALSGEVVGEFTPMIEQALGPRNLWVTAYNNDVYGYLPTAQTLREGGYETRGMYSGSIGMFTPAAQDVLLEKLREMADKAGRSLP